MIQGICDVVIAQFYSYLYLLLFLVAIFGIVYFCCYGKASVPKEFSWSEMFESMSQWKTRKPILKKNETRCRRILEDLFQKPFTSVRPNFLKYITGKNLELDGYNPELQIAFEYQGVQHRQFTPLFHKNYTVFTKQLERDEWKRNVCEEKGINLLRIPDTVPYDELEEYIKDWCVSQGLLT